MEEKKKLKHDFKTREDKYLDKEVNLEAKITDLKNILLKKDQMVQTMHMLNPKPDSFYHPDKKMALAKFVRDFKSLAKEADESLDKQKSLELESERLLKASFSHDIMSIVQNGFVDVPSNLQTELDRTKEKLEHCILKKEKEYAVLWNNWVDLLPNNQSSASSGTNPITNFQHHVTFKDNVSFDTVNASSTGLVHTTRTRRPQPKGNSRNARVPSASKSSEVKKNVTVEDHRTSVTPQVDKPKLIPVTPYSKKLHALIPSHSVPQPREFNVVKHSNVIAPEMYKINLSQTSRVDLVPNNQSSASIRTNSITNFQCHVTFKENVSSDMINASSTRILLLSKNQKTMSSECNNIKLAIRNDKSEIVCGTCKQCLVTSNHDACLLFSVNALNSYANKLCAITPPSANQKRHRTQVWKPKQVGFKDRLTYIPKPRLPRFSLKWSPSGRSFDLKGKLVTSKEANCPNDDKACPSNPQEPIRKWFPNSTVFLGRLSKFVSGASTRVFLRTVCFGNDYIAAILGYGDLKWGNITITSVYFVKGLGHNLFLVGQFCDADLEVAFRRNTCFIRDLDGVDLLKGNHSTNLYTINLYDMASASLICLMARKRKRVSHPPKPVLNSKQWLHLLHMDLCGPMRVASINEVIKNFLKKIYVCLQAPVIIVRTDNETEIKNHALKEYFDSVGITHETFAAKTPQQNGFVESRNHTVYNWRTKKIIETMNVTFDELSAMAFEPNSSKPGLQSLTFGQISSRLELTCASSKNTPQRPSEHDLDILFEPLHNEYLGGQPSEAPRTVHAAPVIPESFSSICIYVNSRFCTDTNKFLKYSNLFT
nr:hypothetical protein [Tanacetum cinerariifolium]